MISLKELNPHGYDTTPEIDANLAKLQIRLNEIRAAWGKPMIVTSGLRSQADQIRINPKAMHSNHLSGEACDIYDPLKELQAWCLKNETLLAKVGLWMEDFSATPNWCHFQCTPPKSGNRWFIP